MGPTTAPSRSWWRRLRPYLPLLLIGLAAFGLRLGAMALVREPCPVPEDPPSGTCYLFEGDSRYVAVQAAMLREGKGFGDAGLAMYGLPSDKPGASHPPLFTVFVAGLQTIGLDDPAQWRVVVAAIGSIGVALAGLAAWRVVAGRDATTGPHSRLAGMAAAALAAVSPLLMARDVDFQVEGLVIPLTAGFVVLAYRLWRAPTWANAAWLGLLTGVLWLTRGEQILVLACTIPLFWWGLRDRVGARKRIGLFAAAAGVAAALMAPWVAYNLSRFSEPVLISTNVQITVLLASCDAVYEGKDFGYYNWDCVYEHPMEDAADDSVREMERGRIARAYIADHLGRLPIVTAAKIGRFLNLYMVGDTEERSALQEGMGWVFARTAQYYTWLVAPFAVAGAVWVRRQRRPLSPLLAPMIVPVLIVAVLIPLPRFRVGFDVMLAVLGGIAVMWAWTTWQARRATDVGSGERHDATPEPSAV